MPNATVTDLRAPCLCGCGELPNEGRRWIRGHPARGVGGFKGEPAATVPNPLVPPPDVADGMTDADWAALEAEGPGMPDPLSVAEPGWRTDPRLVEDIPPGAQDGSGPYSDPPPAHGSRSWADAPIDAGPARVTQAVRREVAARIGIPLAILGAVYEMRDPLCGGAFQGIRKELGAELAELACDSPAVLAFLLGRGGAYFRYLRIGFTLLPWLEMIAAHHIMHSTGQPQGNGQAPVNATQPPPPDFARYPA